MATGLELARVACPLCGDARSAPERLVAGFALERCRNCGLVFVNPQPDGAALDRIYSDRDADELIRLYAAMQGPDLERQHKRILALLESYRPGRGTLLDFGCGAGYFVQCAAQRGWQAVGLDQGAWCREAALRRGFSHVRTGVLADEIFPAEHFDVITANQVLEHLPRPCQDIGQLFRLLKRGGLFYANVPNYRCLSIVLGRDDFEHNTPPQHLNYFTPSSLADLVRRAGFTILRMGSYGGLKWENLLGRRTHSTITAAYAPGAARPAAPARCFQLPFKKLARPIVDRLFYRLAKVGMALEVVARRPN